MDERASNSHVFVHVVASKGISASRINVAECHERQHTGNYRGHPIAFYSSNYSTNALRVSAWFSLCDEAKVEFAETGEDTSFWLQKRHAAGHDQKNFSS